MKRLIAIAHVMVTLAQLAYYRWRLRRATREHARLIAQWRMRAHR